GALPGRLADDHGEDVWLDRVPPPPWPVRWRGARWTPTASVGCWVPRARRRLRGLGVLAQGSLGSRRDRDLGRKGRVGGDERPVRRQRPAAAALVQGGEDEGREGLAGDP